MWHPVGSKPRHGVCHDLTLPTVRLRSWACPLDNPDNPDNLDNPDNPGNPDNHDNRDHPDNL